MSVDIETLPYLVTEVLYSYLSLRALNSLMRCSKSLCSSVQSADGCWHSLCARKWDIHVNDAHDQTWYQRALDMETGDLAVYGDLYYDMKTSLRELGAPRGGVSEAQLADLERSVGVQLPRSVRLYYRLAGGDASGALHYGSYSFYDYELDFMIPQFAYHRVHRQLDKYSSLPGFPLFGPIAAGYFVKWDDTSVCCMKRSGDMHPVATSLPSLLKFRARSQRTGHFLNNELWPMSDIPTAVTHGIQVQASVLYVPQLSNTSAGVSSRAFFAYRIIIQPVGEVEWCQLTRRHWEIEPEGQPQENVDGEGVIGMFPVMHTDADVFMYQSCCPLTGTQRGVMRGSFEFQRRSGEKITVVVPSFTFDASLPITPV